MIVILLSWISYSVSISNSISGFFIELSKPVIFTKENICGFFHDISVSFRSKIELEKENANLKTELEARDLQILNANLIKIENEELQEMANRVQSGKYVASFVFSRPSSSPYDTLLIDQGENSGISEGDKVFYNDVLIGKIDGVYSKTSKISLFSSPGNEFDVKIGSTSFSTKAIARGGGNFVAQVPKGMDVKEGDSVLIPDVSSKVFALVEKVESDPADTFLTVYFKNPLNLFEIKWVEVRID